MSEKIKTAKIERMVDQGENTVKHGYQPKYGITGKPPQGGSGVTPPSSSSPTPGAGNPSPPAPSPSKKE